MSNGKQQRNKGGSSQRRRRGRGDRQQQHQPRGPVMTPLGESTYEAVFDHGNEGYGVWFDGVVREDPMYRQHWKGNRPIFVKIEDDRILITRELPSELAEPDEEPTASGEPQPESEAAGEPPARRRTTRKKAEEQQPEQVYTAEEAARLFVEGGEAADTAETEAGAPTDSGANGSPTRTPRRKVARAATEESEEAPAPRRTTRRKKAEDPAAEGGANGGEPSDGSDEG